MCGIAGSFAPTGRARKLALELLRHRGPDAVGEFLSDDRDCWLGHTRLAIIELSAAGDQPMIDSSGRYVIVFNGEIYNHMELRSSLGRVAWRGTSDTESVVEAWARWQEASLDRLRGMFALAIYDTRERKLVLVRDRFGIKPLYFRDEPSGISFASETRPLNNGSRPQLNAESTATFLAYGHLPAAGCVGDRVSILPAGSMLRLDSDGSSSLHQWWDLRGEVLSNAPSNACPIETVRSLVRCSVREHLLADVPVGCFLSGGIDSSVLAVTAAAQLDSALRTFTVGFPQAEYDERSVARDVARQIGASHCEVVLSSQQCQDLVVEAVESMDCPSVDAINTFIVSKAARTEGIKVALSGLGADEIFGGYKSFRAVSKLAWLRFIPPALARQLLARAPRKLKDKFGELDRHDAFSLAVAFRKWLSKESLVRLGVTAGAAVPEQSIELLDTYASVSEAELRGYMEPMLLRDSDQMSMAVSLELRVPFLDHRLICYALGLPAKSKSGSPPKRLLIDAFRNDLPERVWNRPKMGFSLPMSDWIRGPLRDFAQTGLKHAGSLLESREVNRRFDAFDAGKLHWTRIWPLVLLGHYSHRQQCTAERERIAHT